MKRCKRAAALFFAVALWALPLLALAGETAPDTELEGFITEVIQDGFLMEDAELGEVLVNVSDATVFDGILLDSELAAGQYVMVQYNGRTTRSLPPQAHADKVSCFVLSGVSAGMAEPGLMLMEDDHLGQVLVHLGSEAAHVHPGVPVTVYYDGVMALSLPGQVAARAVIVPELRGTVSETDETGFVLTDGEGGKYRVLVTEETQYGMLVSPEDGESGAEAEAKVSANAEEAAAGEPDGDAEAEAEAEVSADAEEAAAGEPDGDVEAEAEAEVSVDAEEATADEPDGDAEAEAEAEAVAVDTPDGNAEADGDSDAATETSLAGNTAKALQEGDEVIVYYNGVLTPGQEDELTALTALEVLGIR